MKSGSCLIILIIGKIGWGDLSAVTAGSLRGTLTISWSVPEPARHFGETGCCVHKQAELCHGNVGA